MRFVDDLFKNYSVIEDTLVPYGFYKDGESYQYSQLIYNGEFELQVLIKNKILYARLIELAFNEEYTAIDRESIGGFIAGLKEQCQTILLEIRTQCFQKEYFHFAQTKRIATLIKEKYGIEVEKNI